MAAPPQVGIVGLKAVVRDINKMSANAGELNRALSAAGKLAAEPIAARARSTVPHVSGTLAGSIRTTGTRTGAAVRMGRKNVPYAGPVDFGGWPAGRDYISSGRYLYPAAEGLAARAAEDYSVAAGRAFETFNWTNKTTNPEAVHD